MWETGLGDYWRKKHSPPPYKCFITNNPERPKNAPLKLEDLSSAFFILGIGIGLSIFVFIVEKIVAYYFFQSNCRGVHRN